MFVVQEAVLLGFSNERRCVRGLEAVVARLLKFVDEGVELRERRNLMRKKERNREK